MSSTRDVYRVDGLPVFQNRMFSSAEAARTCARGDLILTQSLQTGLIFNRAFEPALMVYDQDYQNEQGLSAAFNAHLEATVDLISRHLTGRRLIEVGCGKGLFLEKLCERGFDITGLDPTYEGVNPRVIKEYFGPEIGLRADGIVLRHVLEHVQNPVEFLTGLRASNGGDGMIYIEVPCLDWIAKKHAWFDIFYEHVNYFRIGDFERMFGAVHEIGHCFGGQYLYVLADLATLRRPAFPGVESFHLPNTFTSAITTSLERLAMQEPGVPLTIWGGASKGVIFALLMERAGAAVDTVIDINPAKQGRFLAATGLRVSTPAEGIGGLPPGADLYVMNSNYLAEVRAMTGNQFNYRLVEHEDL